MLDHVRLDRWQLDHRPTLPPVLDRLGQAQPRSWPLSLNTYGANVYSRMPAQQISISPILANLPDFPGDRMMLASARPAIAEHLEIAWARIPAWGGDFDLPDVIAFADTRANWASFRDKIIDGLINETYSPDHVEIVDLPKDRLTVRPLARLSLKDRLVYEACVFAMAPVIDAAVPRAVYSYRWGKRKRDIYNSVSSWLRMQRRGRYLHKHNPAHMLARTDVTSFYEYVDVDILMEDLAPLKPPEWARDTLGHFLRSFNDLNQAWGLPQSSDASGILANLYLLPVDMEIITAGISHLRYSDDIHMFGDDWLALRTVLLSINRVLRARRLSLAHSKTKIVDSHSVLAVFEDAEKDVINYGVANFPKESVGEVRDYFDRTVAKDPVSPRDLRFVLSKLRLLKDDYAIPWLLSNLGEIPHLALESLRYLHEFYHARPTMANDIIDLLVNSKLAIYPYAEQHLLSFLICHRIESDTAKRQADSLLFNRNKESYVREMAARYLGQHPAPGDGARLKQAFQSESNLGVKRALLIACYEAGIRSDKLLSSVVAAGGDLSTTARYLRQAPRAVPVPYVQGGRT